MVASRIEASRGRIDPQDRGRRRSHERQAAEGSSRVVFCDGRTGLEASSDTGKQSRSAGPGAPTKASIEGARLQVCQGSERPFSAALKSQRFVGCRGRRRSEPLKARPSCFA